MTTTTAEPIRLENITPPVELRVAMLADSKSFYRFGPVLRRLTIGLIDDVRDLSLISFDQGNMLDYVPCPPVGLIVDNRKYSGLISSTIARKTKRIVINAPRWAIIDTFFPKLKLDRITEALNMNKPTLIHALGESQAPLARSLSKRLNIPYVVTLFRLNDCAVKFSQKRCGAILTCNSEIAQATRKKNPNLTKKIKLSPIGTHVTDSPACFAKASKTTKIICCAPMKHQTYGVATLISAIKILIDKGIELELIISSIGPDENAFRKQVHQLKLESHIHFTPRIRDMLAISDSYKAIFKDTDIYVQPWPAKFWQPELLEAMSVGNAVVIAEGLTNDLIIKDKTAALFPYKNKKALAQTIENLITNKQSAIDLATGAQDHLRKHFKASKMITSHVTQYKNALAANQKFI